MSMEEIRNFINEWGRCCIKSVQLLVKSPKRLTEEEQVRRMLYYRFGVIMLLAFISGVGAFVLLQMPMMILFSVVGLLIFVLYSGHIEGMSERGALFYIRVCCVSAKKTWKIAVKPVFTYHFQGVGSDSGVNFSLNRTEELGFVEGVSYLFCFRKAEEYDTQVDNSHLIHYVELSQFTSDSEAANLQVTTQEAQENAAHSPKSHNNGIKFAEDEEE